MWLSATLSWRGNTNLDGGRPSGRRSQTWVSLPGLTLTSTHANAWMPLLQSPLNNLLPLGAGPGFSLPVSSQTRGAGKRGILTKSQNRLSQQRGLQVLLATPYYQIRQKLCWSVAAWENSKSNPICKWFIHLFCKQGENKEYGGG